MADVHYFQRYSGKENTVTNNTLLLFSRLYHHNNKLFKKFLNGFIIEEETNAPQINSMVRFVQQERSGPSVPDGVIEQESFKIVIETKLHNQFNVDQLLNHIESFGDEKNKFLLLISTEPIDDTLKTQVVSALKNRKEEVNFIYTTFEEIINNYKECIHDYDVEMNMLIDDYEQYCEETNLIDKKNRTMRVIPVGSTLKHNIKYKLYYAPRSRGYRNHKYIGLYNEKCVKGIGKITMIVDADYHKDTDELNIIDVHGNDKTPNPQVTENISKDIIDSMKQAEAEIGYNIYEGHRFFIVDEFYKTDFRKKSPYGLRGSKFFDLTEYIGEKEGFKTGEIQTKEIAKKLDRKTWE